MSGMQPGQDVSGLLATLTMPIAQWNRVMEILSREPWREINPLLMDLHRQLEHVVRAHMHPPAPPNGLSRSMPPMPYKEAEP